MNKRNLGKCRDEHDEIWYWEKDGQELCPMCVLMAENAKLRDVLVAARKFIPVAGPDGYSTALADAIARYDRDKEAKP